MKTAFSRIRSKVKPERCTSLRPGKRPLSQGFDLIHAVFERTPAFVEPARLRQPHGPGWRANRRPVRSRHRYPESAPVFWQIRNQPMIYLRRISRLISRRKCCHIIVVKRNQFGRGHAVLRIFTGRAHRTLPMLEPGPGQANLRLLLQNVLKVAGWTDRRGPH
jgi:hypothetical protein